MAPRSARAGTSADTELLGQLEAIELAAAAVLDAIAGSLLLDPAVVPLVQACAAHHRAHATAWTEGIEREPGTVAAPDQATFDRLAPAAFVAVDSPSLLAAALAVEQAMTATAVDAAARFDGAAAAALAARIAPVEARHRSALAAALGLPPATASPAATGDAEGSLLDD